MSGVATSEPRELQVGGPVDSAHKVYISRDSDRTFIELVKGGEFVNVVTSRQMGKTSLVFRAMAVLEPQGHRFAYVDLSRLHSETDPRIYFRTLVQEIARELRRDLDLDSFWAQHNNQAVSQGFIDFFRQVLAHLSGPVVVVLDEIDSTLERDFTDDLFTGIRSIYTSRPRETSFKRLSFCLVGVATPNELIKAPRTTPYNIGRTLWLPDFDARVDDLESFARVLSPDPALASRLLSRVLYWTGGQPYLTARLCDELAREQAQAQGPQAVDELVEQSFTSLEGLHHDAHFEQTLRFISARVSNSAEVMGLYKRILRRQPEKDQAANLAYAHLKLSGLVKRDESGLLVPRNRIYERLFNLEWVQKSWPALAATRSRRIAYSAFAGLGVALFFGGSYYFTFVLPVKQKDDAHTELGKQNVSLRRDLRGLTLVVFPGKDAKGVQDTKTAFDRARPHLETLSTGRDALALSLVLSADADSALLMLGSLAGLRRLEVSDPKLTDVASLVRFTGLRELDLAGTRVSDLWPLAKLGGLEALDISSTPVNDISPLAKLSDLKRLNASTTRVTDLAPLVTLRNLEQLDVSNMPVADLAPLSKLPRLSELDVSRTSIKDLSPLRAVSSLRHLAMDGLGIHDFNADGHNPRLTVLQDPMPEKAGVVAKPGQAFRDCAECPQMVVVPAGRFVMGSPQREPERFRDEGPQHTVEIRKPFAVSRFAIRFDEWALCVQDGPCRDVSDSGFGRGARPVINVSWDAARAYVDWLSKRSGHLYRLLSEAEWEYAARAGTNTSRFWGDDPNEACEYANVADRTVETEPGHPSGRPIHVCTDGFAYTAPVGRFKPNAFALYDMLGNVWQWTEDCWHESYSNASGDGRPWGAESGRDCDRRVVRGGGWFNRPGNVRSADRFWDVPWNRGNYLGFRVARTLP